MLTLDEVEREETWYSNRLFLSSGQYLAPVYLRIREIMPYLRKFNLLTIVYHFFQVGANSIRLF